MQSMKFKFITKLFVTAGLGSLILHAPDLRAEAPLGHYTEANATVRDTRTGLIWQQTTTGGLTYTWDAANSLCSGLGSGWRLPTAKELLTLVDVQAYRAEATTAMIDTAAFPATWVDVGWWSSTPLVTANSEAWALDFSDGELYVSDKAGELHARCVR